jgi:hypothetical protein
LILPRFFQFWGAAITKTPRGTKSRAKPMMKYKINQNYFGDKSMLREVPAVCHTFLHEDEAIED